VVTILSGLRSLKNKLATNTQIISINFSFAILVILFSSEINNSTAVVNNKDIMNNEVATINMNQIQFLMNESNQKKDIADEAKLKMHDMINRHHTIDAALRTFNYESGNIINKVI
jgi:hypothetical protein